MNYKNYQKVSGIVVLSITLLLCGGFLSAHAITDGATPAGHGRVTTTQRYCRVCNLKVQRDYHRAMEVIMKRTWPCDDNPDI